MSTGKSTSGGQHSFAQIPRAEIQRSVFNRSCGTKTTFDAGYLVPVFVDEALPGDTFNLNMTTFGRLATPLRPILDNLFVDSFFFAVPIRLLWENFQKFMGEQDNPGDSTDFEIPEMTSPASTGYAIQSLSDYFGIPPSIPDLTHSALWHRAYNLIWNEWFRDQNMQDSVWVDTDDGPDDPADYVLLRRGKRHDYFTSCLPWPQKGPAVELPLGTTAPVVSAGSGLPVWTVGGTTGQALTSIGVANAQWSGTPSAGTAVWETTALEADLSNATAATINQIREAFQIQRLYERDARGGTRYTEIIRSHFGVVSPDSRLQRPEYLGGGSSRVNISPVPQTSSTDATTPQGNLAGFGVTTANRHGFNKSFTEHSVIIGVVCLRADINYQDGLDRMFNRSTRWDFYWPALAHLGEQAVLNKEIAAVGSLIPGSDDLVFGYQERYAEYRYKPSKITGKFRSVDPQSLDYWHVAQDFASVPTLDNDFIIEDPPIDRVIAVPAEPHMLFDAYFDFKCARPMPTYGVPGLIDHF